MIEPAATAIAPGAPHHVDYLSGAASSGDHVFDYDCFLAGSDREAAPQRHLPIGIALREKKTHAQSARATS